MGAAVIGREGGRLGGKVRISKSSTGDATGDILTGLSVCPCSSTGVRLGVRLGVMLGGMLGVMLGARLGTAVCQVSDGASSLAPVGLNDGTSVTLGGVDSTGERTGATTATEGCCDGTVSGGRVSTGDSTGD